jgi:flagellar protein FliO/FliZ
MRCSYITLLGVLAAGSAWSQQDNVAINLAAKFADPDKAAALPTSSVASMGQVTLALVIVLAVLFAAAWGMRRFNLFNRTGQTALSVVQGINLGPKERAVLINVQGRKLLLGVAPGCVNLLLELPADLTGDSTNASAQTTTGDAAPVSNPATPDFKTLLKRSMGLS